jgi:hypothetical protein
MVSGSKGSVGEWLPGRYRFDKLSFHNGADFGGKPEKDFAAARLEIINTVGFDLKASQRATLWYIIGQYTNIKLAYV